MIKGPTLFFTCVALATGIALFHIKYQVMSLESDYKQTIQHIYETQEHTHILKAEWAHLNEPKRLQALAIKHLNIGPIKGSQFIPMRLLAPSDSAYDRYALDQLISDTTSSAPKKTAPVKISTENGQSHTHALPPLKKTQGKLQDKVQDKKSASAPKDFSAKQDASTPKDPIGDLIVHMV